MMTDNQAQHSIGRLILIGAIAGGGVPFLAAIALFAWLMAHSTAGGISPEAIIDRFFWMSLAIGVGAAIECASSLVLFELEQRGRSISVALGLTFLLLIPWLATTALYLLFAGTIPAMQTAANGKSMGGLLDFVLMGGLLGIFALILGGIALILAGSHINAGKGARVPYVTDPNTSDIKGLDREMITRMAAHYASLSREKFQNLNRDNLSEEEKEAFTREYGRRILAANQVRRLK